MRLIAAACACLCVLAFSESAGASYLKHPPTLFGVHTVPVQATQFSDRRKRKRYRKAHVRAVHGATGNLFRQYQAASTSRSCLTAQTSAVLSRLEARFGAVQIVSTCRPGATIAGSGRPSYHRYGMAVDFNPARGASRQEVIRFLYAQGTLVMTYRSMRHIHFNLGQGARIAYGGGKRKARRSYAAAQ